MSLILQPEIHRLYIICIHNHTICIHNYITSIHSYIISIHNYIIFIHNFRKPVFFLSNLNLPLKQWKYCLKTSLNEKYTQSNTLFLTKMFRPHIKLNIHKQTNKKKFRFCDNSELNMYLKQMNLVNSQKPLHFLLLIKLCQQCSYNKACYCLATFHFKMLWIFFFFHLEKPLSID